MQFACIYLRKNKSQIKPSLFFSPLKICMSISLNLNKRICAYREMTLFIHCLCIFIKEKLVTIFEYHGGKNKKEQLLMSLFIISTWEAF